MFCLKVILAPLALIEINALLHIAIQNYDNPVSQHGLSSGDHC